MADSDKHRSVLAYAVGAALGGIALAVTAWVGLRGRKDGAFGFRRRGGDEAAHPSGGTDVADEDIV